MDKEKREKLTPVLDNFEAAVKVWWKNLKKIVMIYLWGLMYAFVPLVIIAVLLGVNYWLGDSAGVALRLVTVVIAVLGFLLSMYFLIRAYISIFLFVKHDFSGKEKELFRESRRFFWPYFGLVLLTIIFVILWSLLLIIPGIIYSVLYSFACYALFFEDKRGMAAIRRSVKLATGYFWPILGRFLFVGVIVWVFSVIVAIPLSFADENSIFASLWSGVLQVVNLLVGPIVLFYTYNIYRELVKIKK